MRASLGHCGGGWQTATAAPAATRTLRDTGIVGAVAALFILPALHAGVVPGLVATAVLAFGAFGFNGILYVTVGELAGPARSGVGVGLASTVVFGAGALVTPVVGVAVEQLGYGALWVITGVGCAAGAAVVSRWLPPGRYIGMTQSPQATSRTRSPGTVQCPVE